MLRSLRNWLKKEINFKIGLITTDLSLRELQTRGLQQRYTPFDFKMYRYLTQQHSLAYTVDIIQKGFLGLWGEKVDSIDFYKEEIKDLDQKVSKHTTSLSTYKLLYIFWWMN